MHEMDKTETILRQILAENPAHPLARNNLGALLHAQGRYREAAAILAATVNDRPEYTDAWYNYGLTLKKLGRFTDASIAFKNLLQLAPDHLAARFQLGSSQMAEGKFEIAIAAFLEIEKHQPEHTETQANLATCYLKLGALQEAITHYRAALALNPHDTQILYNLGVITAQLQQIDPAIGYYQRVLQQDPQHFASHYNLGILFASLQARDRALDHLLAAQKIEPDNATVQHLIRALQQNQKIAVAPPAYLASLFDSYADHYDQHLQKTLGYRLPDMLAAAVQPHLKKNVRIDILDLGCGTGLCGVAFQKMARKLDGIDLSEKMLRIAAEKKIYTHLQQADFTTFPASHEEKYDLVIAGDVLVYCGELSEIFHGVARTCRKNGLFAFNIETTATSADYQLQPTGRFAHHRDAVLQLATQSGFLVLEAQSVSARLQDSQPVPGCLYVLKKI